jgi:hypothetical protein
LKAYKEALKNTIEQKEEELRELKMKLAKTDLLSKRLNF